MTQEDLRAIGELMEQKLAPVVQRLDGIDKRLENVEKRLDNVEKRLDNVEQELSSLKERVELLEESQEEVRNGVNTIIGWAEKVSMAATFPLPDIDD